MAMRGAVVLRFFSSDGERSTTLACDAATTVAQICAHFSCDTLSVLVGNFQFQQLDGESSPLLLLRDFCAALSDADVDAEADDDVVAAAQSPSFRHLFAFFLGRGRLNAKNNAEVLVEECAVRTGRVMHSWARCKAYFYNSTIRICTVDSDEYTMDLRIMHVDVHQSRKGRCLRIFDSKTTVLLLFRRTEALSIWLSRAQQTQRNSTLDMSDEHLTLIPEQVINEGNRVEVLNLRRNSLTTRLDNRVTPMGFVEDICRLHGLVAIDLSFNRISTFPAGLAYLPNLEKLNLSSNFISTLPRDVKHMHKMRHLDLSNNLLSHIPNEFEACHNLCNLELSFNSLNQVPEVFRRMSRLEAWSLAGNQIDVIEEAEFCDFVRKLDLRRNLLTSSFRLVSETLTHVDIRDNSHVSTVHLTSLHCLRVLHCERLQLTSLHVNGQSLTHLYADHNLLDAVVVMPLPQNASVISLSHNQLRSLPDWVADLPRLTFLRVNNNLLDQLPPRLFCSRSLKCLFAFDNRIESLPGEFEDNVVETLIVYRNHIRHLPLNFFRGCQRLRQLNISLNELQSLPPFDSQYPSSRLQILRVASNRLDESTVPTIVNMKNLKTLDVSNNLFNSFDDSALSSLTLLEEISLSSNRLSRLSDALGQLPALQVLRAHSNRIENLPDFSQSTTLHTLDVCANNIQLSTLQFLPPSTLRNFDLSCNSGAFFSEKTLRSKKRLEVVDLSSRINGFRVGFAESHGAKNRLCVRCLRVGSVWAMIDGGSNYQLPNSVLRFLNNFLRQNENEELKRVLVQCHCALGEEGERLGASVVLMRIGKKVEVVGSGSISAAVVRNGTLRFLFDGRYEIDDDEYSRIREGHGFVDDDNLINGVAHCARQIGHYSLFPLVTPSPSSFESEVDASLEGVVVANRPLWELVAAEDVVDAVRSSFNALLVAKRLQDQLQSFDYAGNSSILVAKVAKPQMSFTEHTFHARPVEIVEAAKVNGGADATMSSSSSQPTTSPDLLPPPPPLPRSLPPAGNAQVAKARESFQQKRDVISKSLNFASTTTQSATFQI